MRSLSLRSGLKRLKGKFEGRGVEAFAHMDDVTLGLMAISENLVRDTPFLRHELDENEHRCQAREDCGVTSTERECSDDGRYITPSKCRRPHCARGRGDVVMRLDRLKNVHYNARGVGSRRWRRR